MLGCLHCLDQIGRISTSAAKVWSDSVMATEFPGEYLAIDAYHPDMMKLEALERKGFVMTHEINQHDRIFFTVRHRNNVACIFEEHDYLNKAEWESENLNWDE